jgi:hypothetical protein
MKDLIIGCTTNYDWSKLKYWVNSINQSGFEGDKVMIAFNISYETVEKLTKAGFQVIIPGTNNEEKRCYEYQSSLPVHVERFIHIYNYLDSHDNYRFVITTDVKDVVFQKDPTKFLGVELPGSKLMFASESIKLEWFCFRSKTTICLCTKPRCQCINLQ